MTTGTINFGESDYQRGFRDGQEARKRDDAQRSYERGFRDGYGSPWPIVIPAVPYYPTPYPTMPLYYEPTITWCQASPMTCSLGN